MADTPRKVEAICQMSRDGKTNKEIAEHFCCSTAYICKTLKNNGIHHRLALPPDDDVVANYNSCLSSYKTAFEFGINQKSVLKILHRNNVEATGLEHYRLNAKQSEESLRTNLSGDVEADVIASYKETLSSYKTAEQFGLNQKTVLKILHRSNIALTGIQNYRRSAERYPREIQEKMKNEYEAGTSVPELKNKYGGSIDTVCQAIRRVGGEIRPPRGRHQIVISPEQEQEICKFHQEGMSQTAIGIKLGYDQRTISRILRNNGIRARKREKHPKYKGGRALHHQGYIYVWIPQDDPMASMRIKQGYVLEHRLVLARKLGRPLLPTETVHHIDGNKQNNDPDNLQLRVGKHGGGQSMECADCKSQNIVSGDFLKCGDCGSPKVRFSSI